MPVVVDTVVSETGYVEPSDIGVETTIFEVYAETKQYIVEGYISLQEMQSGDSVILREYLATDGTNYQKYAELAVGGVQSEPTISIHTKMLNPQVKYRLTITQKSGTVRRFYYSFVKMTLTMV